jgi:hypothetical protein
VKKIKRGKERPYPNPTTNPMEGRENNESREKASINLT